MSEIRHIPYNSTYLNKQMAFAVYLPDEYKYGGKFPVLYFLHGRNGDESFIEQLGLAQLADTLIAKSKIEPMIIVCPRMDNSRGLNSAKIAHQEKIDGNFIDVGRYEDYFIQEIVPFVDDSFNTIPSRNGRYVGGASAGGFAAIHYGLRYPGLFSKIGGHMPAVELDLDPSDVPYYGSEEEFHQNNPLEFGDFNEYHNTQSWYLDAGDKDEGGFDKSVNLISNLFRDFGISIESHIHSGHHNLRYIQNNMAEYLTFYNGKKCTKLNK